MLTIGTFNVHAPDSDGDIRLDFEAELTNDADETVRMVRSQSVLFSADGTPLDVGGKSDEYVRLDEGDCMTMHLNTPYLKSYLTGADWDSISTKLYVTTFKRHFTKLGELAVPSKPRTPAILKASLGDGPLEADVRIVFSVDEDDDGDRHPRWKCVLVNATGAHIPKAVLKAELVDEEDAIIDTTESDVEIAAHSCDAIDASIWGVKKSQLRGARMRFSLSTFSPIKTVTAQAKATIADED